MRRKRRLNRKDYVQVNKLNINQDKKYTKVTTIDRIGTLNKVHYYTIV